MATWVRVKPGRRHRFSKHGAGDVIAVTDGELRAFADKFDPAEVDATDAATELAAERELSLADIAAEGRITKADVEAVVNGDSEL
jgi:hypothetical protein